MRPPESFSTAAVKRRSHSCWVSLIVAVLSFMTNILPACACAGDASPMRVVAAKPAAPTAVSNLFQLGAIHNLPGLVLLFWCDAQCMAQTLPRGQPNA